MANFSGPKRAVVLLGGATLIASLSIPAVARGGPPKAVLRSKSDRQVGHSVSFSKGRYEGDGMCSLAHGDGFYDWQPALSHRSGHKLHLRFRKDRKPDAISIRDSRKLNGHDSPKGDSRKVLYKLKRLRNSNDNTVAWEAVFRRRDPGHHYLDVNVSWHGEHDCQSDGGHYNFHVKTVA